MRAAYPIRSGVEGGIRSSVVQGQDSEDLGEIFSFGGLLPEYWRTRWLLDGAGHTSKGVACETLGESNATLNVEDNCWRNVWRMLRTRVGLPVDGNASALHTRQA